MKNTILSFLIAGAIGLASISALATGPQGIDPVQTGVLNFTAATGSVITNSFPFTYTTPPVIVLVGGTNTAPITNVLTTTTNFVVGITNNTTVTNGSVSWTAFVGFPRIETGTIWGTNSVAGLITNTFSPPFSFGFAPTVVQNLTGTNPVQLVAITNITSSNFVAQFQINSTNQFMNWMAFGVGNASGTYNPNFPSVTY